MTKRGRPKSPWNEEAVSLICQEVYLQRLEDPRDVEPMRQQPEKLLKRSGIYTPVVRATLDAMREHGISVEACFKNDR